MAIWRGTGGPGDATTDAASEASAAVTAATNAANSATAAASSATSAATSASASSTSASNSATSATSSASSATSAASSASAASTSASNASTSATAASNAQGYAEEWATKAEDSLISTVAGGDGSTDYSSLHHAAKASASASAAASSASAASSSASAAATAQTNAETAETNAETAQTAAEAARDAALAALDNFDDRYLGEKASDPTLDNDGDALVAGSLYFNTTTNVMKVYTGSAWVAAYVSGSINLDDVVDVVISTPADNEVLAYDSTSGNWINQTTTEAGLVATSDIGSTVQAYDADTAKYDDVTANFTGTLQNGGSNVVVDSDIGSTVQAYSSVLAGTTASFTTADETKLGGIETSADVTDATNVAAAGAVMDGDFLTNGLMKRTGAGTYTIVTDNSSEWDTAYSWGNHASAGYLTSETYTGTVTSVAATVPTGFTVSGSPVTTTGTLAVSFDTGYSLPTTASQTNWDTAYGWGDHSTQNYATTTGDTMTGTLNFGDNVKAQFGASNDLQIYHDGSNSYISDEGTGTLRVRSSNQLVLQVGDDAGGWENAILANNNAGVDLRYNNAPKLSTTGTGVSVTGKAVGTLTTDNDASFDMNASNHFKCTLSQARTLTFTNITAGQTGQVLLINSGGYTVSAAATTKVSATALATISTAGTYILSYFSDGTNVYVVNSGALA